MREPRVCKVPKLKVYWFSLTGTSLQLVPPLMWKMTSDAPFSYRGVTLPAKTHRLFTR